MNKKGFSLAELLIVVAIIAVLVAISIPILSNRLEKSREATDLANVRSAYSKVMVAAMSGDTAEVNPEGVIHMHDRWYIDVELVQKEKDWQTDTSTLVVGGVGPANTLQWVGVPSAGGNCLVSYTKDHGVVFAWQYNFAQIMNNTPASSSNAAYDGKTVTQLIHEKDFTMLESSGLTGQNITSQIKHQLGKKDSDDFAYKILPAKDYGKNFYMIFISETGSLKTNVAANQTNVGEIEVTGYIYEIREDGSSHLVKQGTPQVVSTYSNGNKQEKMDVFGNQDNCATIKNKANNTPYSWDL